MVSVYTKLLLVFRKECIVQDCGFSTWRITDMIRHASKYDE